MVSELLVIGGLLGVYFQPEQIDNNWMPILLLGMIGGVTRMLSK